VKTLGIWKNKQNILAKSDTSKREGTKKHKVQKLMSTACCTCIPKYLNNFKWLYLVKYFPKMAQTKLESLEEVLSYDYSWSTIGVFF